MTVLSNSILSRSQKFIIHLLMFSNPVNASSDVVLRSTIRPQISRQFSIFLDERT